MNLTISVRLVRRLQVCVLKVVVVMMKASTVVVWVGLVRIKEKSCLNKFEKGRSPRDRAVASEHTAGHPPTHPFHQ